MDERKVKGAWVITVKGPEKRENVPEQSNDHQVQQADEELRGGAK